jgi:hypothetical protein
MFRRRDQIREKLLQIIELFRKKGAISPENALSAKDLGLPKRFENSMNKRLGKLGVFIEVDGKYYLSEERLKEIEKRIASRKNIRD